MGLCAFLQLGTESKRSKTSLEDYLGCYGWAWPTARNACERIVCATMKPSEGQTVNGL